MPHLKKLTTALLLLSQIAFADKPSLFLLKTYDEGRDLVGWVMSEKLDGVRGFWDGGRLMSRGGKEIFAPKWFLAGYPPFAIDGELWTQRGDFEEVVSIVRRKKADARWRGVSHQIFEVPNQAGGLLQRLSVLKKYLQNHPNTPIKIIQQTKITDNSQVKKYLQQVVDGGGEGVVARNPNIKYKIGRLASALKLKKFLDAECVVSKILPGKGKYLGKMGAVQCRTIDGKIIKIGTGFTDFERGSPPKIGSKITFKYYGYTKKGKPKFPVYLRPRPELTQ